jgi:hypothetical protein
MAAAAQSFGLTFTDFLAKMKDPAAADLVRGIKRHVRGVCRLRRVCRRGGFPTFPHIRPLRPPGPQCSLPFDMQLHPPV